MATELQIVIKGVDKASSVFGGIGSAAGKLGGIAKGALLGGLAAAAGGAAALGAGLFDSVGEAAAAQEVQAQLAAVLESTGGIAGWTAEKANELAGSLMDVTRFEDDAILSGQNLLLTFTGIGKDVFPDATETMLDMSQALGQDLKSSAVQLGKALNDPVQGVTALQRVGISFTDEQKEMIKAMVESGDTMGAQKFILAELNREFGGAARAAGETFAGKLDRLKNKFGDIKESIGNAVLPLLDTLATKLLDALGSPEVQAAIDRVVTWLGENLPVVIEQVATFITEQLVPVLQTVFAWLAENIPLAIATVSEFWNTKLRPALEAVWAFIQNNVIPIFQTVAGWFSGEGTGSVSTFVDKIQTALGPVLEFARKEFGVVVTWVQENWPLIQRTIQVVMDAIKKVVETVVGAIRSFWESHGEKIMAFVGNMWDLIKTVFDTALKTILDLVKGVMQLITGDTEGFKATMEGIWERLKDAGKRIFEALKENLLSLWNGLLEKVRGAWDSFKDWLSRTGENIVEGIKSGISNAWESFKNWFKDKISGLLDSILDLLGIHSRSQVFYDMAQNMMLGLKDGIAAFARGPELELKARVTKMVNGFPAMAGTSYGSGGTVIYNIVRVIVGTGAVRSDRDIELIAEKVAAALERMQIRRGNRALGVT